MIRSTSAYLAVLVGLFASSCGDVAGPDRDNSPVQTDATSYKFKNRDGEYRVYVMATYQNTGVSSVSFKRCMPGDTLPMFDLARTGPDSMRTFFTDWAWACVGGVPTGVIAPGRSVTVKVPFGSFPQPNMQPPLQLKWLEGTFRIYLSLCRTAVSDSDYCELLPREERQSNAFLVHF